MKALTWVKEKTANGAVFPSCREGHTVTYIPKLRCIFLFGGICNNRMNDLYRYDIDKNSWTIQETNGRQPTARCHHSAFYEDPYYFVFSGQGDSGRSLIDLYILHTKTWEWKRLFMLQAPNARHSTQICDMKNSAKEKIVFGGVCWPGNKHFNDVWVINYQGVDFKSGMKELTGTVCTQKKTKGDLPAPRRGHCAITYNKCLYVYGGKGEEVDPNEKDAMNWIHQLSLETWTWKKISGIARPTYSRYFASYFVWMFGGIDNQTNQRLNDIAVLNLQDFHWSCPFIAGHLPTPRYNHAACVCDTQYLEKAMVVIGGLDSVYCNMDIYKLVETEFRDKVQWEKLTRPSPMEKMASEIAGATLLDQRNYMDELEHIISHERTYGLELEQEIEKLEEDLKLAKIQHTTQVEAKEYENQSLEEEINLKEEAKKNLMISISREQQIFESLTSKNVNLEEVIQNTESYLIGLDKLFSAITKLKFNDQDEQDRKLRYLSDHTKDEVSKSKDLHRASLQALKLSYDEYNKLSKQTETDLMIQRNNVLEIDKNFEETLLNFTLEEN